MPVSFPFRLLTSPSALGEGEFHAISCLNPPHPPVKADAKALALTSCQPPCPQHDSTDALLCGLCTIVLGPALLKQKLSLSPAWSSTLRMTQQGLFHRHPWWTEQNLPGHIYGYLESPAPTLYLMMSAGTGLSSFTLCLTIKTCLRKEFSVNCFTF